MRWSIAHAALVCNLAVAAYAQAPPQWTIGERPLVSIGADGGDTLILRSWSALRLSNGHLVVASNRDSRLQWFDANGRHLRSVGRRGQGPEEFGGSIYLYHGGGDTIVAHDERNRRFHYLSPAGRFLKLDTLGDRSRAAWAYNRTALFRIPAGVDRQRLAQTLDRIPFAPRDTIRLARVDRGGNVWIESPGDPQSFSVYSPDAALIGTLSFPPKFNAYEILDTLVLGHWTDEDDIEHIQLRRLTRTRPTSQPAAPGSVQAGYDQTAEFNAHRVVVARMQAALRNLFTAQESYYSTHRRYAPTLDELVRAERLQTGYKVTFIRARPNSYAMLVESPTTRITCIGVIDGVIRGGGSYVCG